MTTNRIIKTECILSISGAAGLLIWWFLMPVFLPVKESSAHFELMVLDNNWVQINVIGLVSTLLLTLGFPGFYMKGQDKLKKAGFIGLIMASTGLVLFACIQYYETLIWPAAARINPELLQVNGALVSGDIGVAAGLVFAGALLGLGYMLFGIAALKTRSYPGIPIWFIMIGAPVFGNGIVFPVRTAGLLLLCSGTIWLAKAILNDRYETD